MKIRSQRDEADLDVYAVYWVDDKRYYYVIPYEGYEGFSARAEGECEVVDPILGRYFRLVKDSQGFDMLIHDALARDNLLDDLLEHDPRAMGELRRRLLEEYSQ